MTKPKTPNQKSKYRALNIRLAKYVILVQDIYESLNKEASKIALGTGYSDSETKPFRFSDYPEIKDKVESLQAKFVSELNTLIYIGTSEEWKQSNLVQDLIADKVLKSYTTQVDRQKYKMYYQTNSDALKAFQQRKDRGLNLSAKLWKQSKTYKEGLEAAISTAIQKGTSAVTLSKRISKYLTDFKSLQKDYKERFGTATNAKDCEYRSIRLARSEINMAYRKAENERWRQMDFVVGYEIKLSEKHPEHDMCDALAGRYPKDFEWTGWHPNDLCYKIPILKTEDEFFAEDDAVSKNEVTDMPNGFKKWVVENQEYIKSAEKKGTQPYFIRDNRNVVTEIMHESARPKKFVMTNDVVEGLRVNGVIFGSGFGNDIATAYQESQMSGFDLLSFDGVIENICDKYKILIGRKKIDMFENGHTYLSYDGRLESGRMFAISRSFIEENGKRIVEHSAFVVPTELQGRGISKEIFRNLFTQYESMGIDEVHLFANISVGGYAWAKYGFCTDKLTAYRIIREAYYDNEVIGKDLYDRLERMIGSVNGDSFPMDMIANLPEGKKILLGQNWDGHINLHDKKQMGILKDYIGF